MIGVKLLDDVKGFLLDLRRRSRIDTVLISGLAAGLAGLVISFGLKGLVPARPLGDPLPLILSATQLTRGLLYFPWRPPTLAASSTISNESRRTKQ